MPEVDLRSTVVAIPGTNNVRDLGGLVTRDGLQVRFGRLFRAETLAREGATDRLAVWAREHDAHYRALALRTVVDLRSPIEVDAAPSAWAMATGAATIRLPLPEGGEGTGTHILGDLMSGRRSGVSVEDLAELYTGTLDRRATELGELVGLLAEPERHPVLVHCSAGKDRTGVAAALVLEVLGVERATVVADYALTGLLRPNRVEAYADTLLSAGVDPRAAQLLFDTPARAMELALQHLDETYGGAEAYLVAHAGVTETVLDSMRRHLLEPVGAGR